MDETKKNRRKLLLTLLILALFVGGILIICFCWNIASFKMEPDGNSFEDAMIAFAKWLIIPLCVVMISSITILPIIIYDNEKMARLLTIIFEILAVAGSVYLYFFTSRFGFKWPDGILNQILYIIPIILSFGSLLVITLMCVAIPLAFGVNFEISYGVYALIAIIAIPFLNVCGSYINMNFSTFWWGLLAFALQASGVPIIVICAGSIVPSLFENITY